MRDLEISCFFWLISGICISSISAQLIFKDKQKILNTHNWIRSQVAVGAYGLPPLSNMLAVDWSSNLEKEAELMNQYCQSEYEISLLPSHNGNVLIFMKNVSLEKETFNGFQIFLHTLSAINRSMTEDCKDLEGDCKIIGQVLEPSVTSVGCSLRKCGHLKYTLICVYDHLPTAMPHLQALNVGEYCSKCPATHIYCLGQSLCASATQCSKALERKCEPSPLENITSRPTNGEPNIDITNPILLDDEAKCKDRRSQCQSWATQGLCFLRTIRNDCLKSCTKCIPDRDRIRNIMAIVAQSIEGEKCEDTKPQCQDWADKYFCTSVPVQIMCPKVCAICPGPMTNPSIGCNEDEARALLCKDAKENFLCYSPEMKDICPVTCGNIKCGTPLPTTPFPGPCTEPPPHKKPCLDFKKVGYCTAKDVGDYCRITCETGDCKKSSMTSSMSISSTTEAPECPTLKELCQNQAIKDMCKETCGTTIITSTVTTSSSISTSSLVSSTSGSSKPFTTDPSNCVMLKDLCANPAIKDMCKQTCQTTTVGKTSSSSTTGSSSTLPTDPPRCKLLKNLCHNTAVQMMCKQICASSTTSATTISESSTKVLMCSTPAGIDELEECSKMAPHCSNPGVADLCPFTCGVCGPTVTPHTEEPSTKEMSKTMKGNTE